MPNIPEYNASNLELRPTETGVEATARAAVRMAGYGNQVGNAYDRAGAALGRGIATAGTDAVRYAEHREISTAARNGSQLVLNTEQDWNSQLKAPDFDPDKPETAAKFRAEVLEPRLQGFVDSMQTEGGRRWAEEFVDRFRNHMYTKTAADMSSAAGQAVVNNAVQSANNFITAAFNDPSSLTFLRDQYDHVLEGKIGSSPNLAGDAAIKLKGELKQRGEAQIVKAAVQGTIVNGGDWRAIASDPANAPFVNAAEMKQFETQQRYYERLADSQQKHATAWQELQDKKASGTAEKQILQSLTPDPAQEHPSPTALNSALRQFGDMPGTTPAQLSKMQHSVEKYISGLGKSDPLTFKAAYDALTVRIFDPEKPLEMHDIIANQDNLSRADRAKLSWAVRARDSEELNDPMLKNAMGGARQLIQGTTAAERTMSAGKYAEFVAAFMPEYLKAKRAGNLPPDALDMSKPDSFISKAMAPYKSSLADVIRSNGGVGAPVAVHVQSIDEATALKPGTHYIAPDGKERVR